MKATLILSISLCLIACTKGAKSHSKAPKYVFPDKTVIHNIEADACLEGKSGEWVQKGKQIEEGLLNTFSGEITPEMQKEAGDDFHKEIIQQFKIADESDPHWKKLRKIFNELKAHAERKDITYTVYLLDDTLLNAFTIPGGNVYVTTKLMDFVKSDDELAVVVGHEIGHNENKHTLKHLQKLNVAEQILGNDFKKIGATVLDILTLPYGQPQELESDRAGVYLAYTAGYDPERGPDFFDRINDGKQREEVDRFLSTHPFPGERSACLKKYLQKCKKGN